MNVYITMDCLAGQEAPAKLKAFSRVATEQAQASEDSSIRKGYNLLATVASLKARVNENRCEQQDGATSLSDIHEKNHEDESEMIYLEKSLALYQHEVVYVEMRDYRGPPLGTTVEQEQRRRRPSGKRTRLTKIPSLYSDSDSDSDSDGVRLPDPRLRTLIKNYCNTFQGTSMTESVCGLDIAGMIDHSEGEHKSHCSILYRLPHTIGAPSRERPAENLRLRAPETLSSLLKFRENPGIRSNLGARFELARKLVRAVCLLHSTGWLHKNIRAELVIFFPEHVSTLQNDGHEVNVEIDVSQPILMGYIFSRPDDISERNPTSTPDREPAFRTGLSHVPSEGPQTASRREQSIVGHVWRRENADPRFSRRREVTPRANAIYGRKMLMHDSTTKRTTETVVSGFTLDYYQHPAKHADPRRLYRHAYDVYSLGILLLEVGLWDRLKNYEDAAGQIETRDMDDYPFLLRIQIGSRKITMSGGAGFARRTWVLCAGSVETYMQM
jgi:hypothetical protein